MVETSIHLLIQAYIYIIQLATFVQLFRDKNKLDNDITTINKQMASLSLPPNNNNNVNNLRNSNNVSIERGISTLENQKKLSSEAFEMISMGLDLDERSPQDACMFYSKGISILRKAVRLEYTPQEWVEARQIHEKMLKNLETTQNRYNALMQEIEQGSNSIITSTVPVASKPSSDVVDLTNDSDVTSSSTSTPKNTISSKSKNSSVNNIQSKKPSTITAPIKKTTEPTVSTGAKVKITGSKATATTSIASGNNVDPKESVRRETLKGIDPKMQSQILDEVMDNSPSVKWDDIAGLTSAKEALKEMVIYPMLRPEIYVGLRTPMRGLLLFGPPGNGKTYLAKAVASEAKATFFSISAATLTSKYLGESEKMVKALFAVARYLQPSMIFIDEVDSILSRRSSTDHEASIRLKNEFLLQFDGVGSSQDDRIFIMGATNRPADIDDAAGRRFSKKIYIPLPGVEGRDQIIRNLLTKVPNVKLTSKEVREVVNATDGYSASDLTNLCKDAAMQPIRELGKSVSSVAVDEIRPVVFSDFQIALKNVKSSVKKDLVKSYETWNAEFGSN